MLQHVQTVTLKKEVDPKRPLPRYFFADGQPRPTAAVLVVHPRRKGLLLVQPKKDDTGQTFMLPQGGISFGENVFEAARREVREEIPSFARIKKHGRYKVLWSKGIYLGAALNAAARSGIAKEVHVVIFSAAEASLRLNQDELQDAQWVYDVATFEQLLAPTKIHNPVKWEITRLAVIGALEQGLLKS